MGDVEATFVAVNTSVLDQPHHVPAAAEGRGPIVVLAHHPPFVDEPDEPDL